MAKREEMKQPTHCVYNVIKRQGHDDFWLRLGVAFVHKDGKGFSINLQAFPIDGKLVCRELADEEHDSGKPRKWLGKAAQATTKRR